MKICFFEVEATEERFFETALAGYELIFAHDWQETESDAGILSLYIHTLVSATVPHFNHLELITTRSMGYDHIDLDECARRGIVVSNVPGTDANTVVFTAHVAFNSVEAVERINALTVENIQAYLRGQPINVVKK